MNATTSPRPAPDGAQTAGHVQVVPVPASKDNPRPLLDALWTFVAGTPGSTTQRVLRNPAVAAVFTADADFRALALGDSLWAAVRSCGDGHCRVIAVHNVSSRSRRFSLPQQLRGPGTSLHFLCGEVRTTDSADESVCELKPWGFVWLAVCEKETPGVPQAIPPSPLC